MFFIFLRRYLFIPIVRRKDNRTCASPPVAITGLRDFLAGNYGIDLNTVRSILVNTTGRMNSTTQSLYAYADAMAESFLRRNVLPNNSIPRFENDTAPPPMYKYTDLNTIYSPYGACCFATTGVCEECSAIYTCVKNAYDWNDAENTDYAMCASWSIRFIPGLNSDVHWIPPTTFGFTRYKLSCGDLGVFCPGADYYAMGQSQNFQPACIGGSTGAGIGMGVFSGTHCHYPSHDVIARLNMCGSRYVFGEFDVTLSDQSISSMSLCGGPPADTPACFEQLSSTQNTTTPCSFIPGHIPSKSMLYGPREVFGQFTNVKYPYLTIMALAVLSFIDTSVRFRAMISSAGWPGTSGTRRENWDAAIFDATLKCAQIDTFTPEAYPFYIVDTDTQSYPYGSGPWGLLCHIVRMHSMFACQSDRGSGHCIPIRGTQFIPQVYGYCWLSENSNTTLDFYSQSFVIGFPDPSRPSGVQCNRLNGVTPFFPTSQVSDLSNLALLYLWASGTTNGSVSSIINRIGIYMQSKVAAFDSGQVTMEEVILPPASPVMKCDGTDNSANAFVSDADTLSIYC